MGADPNARIVALHGASGITLLGMAQIESDPALYDEALAAGLAPIALVAILERREDNIKRSGMLFPWCPFYPEELRAIVDAYIKHQIVAASES